MMIPAIVVALLGLTTYLRQASYRRRFSGWRLVWEMWGSTILLSFLLFTLFYWYLFWRPFYRAEVRPDGSWAVMKMLPAREIIFTPNNIEEILLEPETIPPFQFRVRRELMTIRLADGQELVSAPMTPSDAVNVYNRILVELP